MSAPPAPSTSAPEHRAGFASLIGRPNVGKSTLFNRLLGQKLAIVSPKPQTTRNRIRGIVTRPAGQIVYVDTPGLHPPRGKLGRFLAADRDPGPAKRSTSSILVADATAPVDATRRKPSRPPLRHRAGRAGLNKIDLVPDKAKLLPRLESLRGPAPLPGARAHLGRRRERAWTGSRR